MRLSIITRYLLRETAKTWFAVAFVLLMVVVASALSRVLNRAVGGDIDQHVLLGIVGTTAISDIEILIPISLFLAILLALGRFYQDNEMTIIRACGVSTTKIYQPFLLLAVILALGEAWVSLYLSPWASEWVQRLRSTGRQTVSMTATEPGQFRTLQGGRAAFYVESLGDDEQALQKVFVWSKDEDHSSVIWADHGYQRLDRERGGRILVLLDGRHYEGTIGEADYRITHFSELGLQSVIPPVPPGKGAIAKPTSVLLQSSELTDIAELQRRLSEPLLVLGLTLLAVPLAKISPRQGRYSRLVIGLLCYLVYSNLMWVAGLWVANGKVPPTIGIWWVHIAGLMTAAWLVVRPPGMWGRTFYVLRRRTATT